MNQSTFYAILYGVIRLLLWPFLKCRYGFRTDRVPKTNESFLLVSNHTTEDDMLFVMAACPKPVYFVCGEHLLRNPRYGRLLRRLLNPVPVPKGGSTLPAVRRMLKRLTAGERLCLFYEGKRSYHGETIPAPETLGALVKKAGCGLVTYHITGGYFTYPRWARGNRRRGHTEGHVAGVYSAARLRDLSAAEITALINRDTYENAYRTQRDRQWVYKGRRLAEGLESVLFLCPRCGAEDSIRTEGNRLFCARCSLAGEYTERGFLEGSELPYDNVLDWMRWIEREYDDRVRAAGEDACLDRVDGVELYQMDENYINHTLCTAELRLYRDRMELGERVFPFRDIHSLSVLYGNILLFTVGEAYYGLTGRSFKAWKYARLWHTEKGDTHDRTKEI